MDKNSGKVGQEQIHGLLFGKELSWQAIIYDLINSEQLAPWDIDLVVLANKYLERVRELEEANFFVSSKVLLAVSLLLRIKSEILLNQDLHILDEALFGKKEEKSYKQERIEFEEEFPEIVPRTPLPRHKKVSLFELMSALGKAIKTENRRIKKFTTEKQHELVDGYLLPRKTINIQNKIKEIYKNLKEIFSKQDKKLAFSELVKDKDKISTFIPLLHLDSQHKIWLEQENHFEEIWILLKEMHDKERLDESV